MNWPSGPSTQCELLLSKSSIYKSAGIEVRTAAQLNTNPMAMFLLKLFLLAVLMAETTSFFLGCGMTVGKSYDYLRIYFTTSIGEKVTVH